MFAHSVSQSNVGILIRSFDNDRMEITGIKLIPLQHLNVIIRNVIFIMIDDS
jgi:hypothetical protein